jgi:hypothetical protein
VTDAKVALDLEYATARLSAIKHRLEILSDFFTVYNLESMMDRSPSWMFAYHLYSISHVSRVAHQLKRRHAHCIADF